MKPRLMMELRRPTFHTAAVLAPQVLAGKTDLPAPGSFKFIEEQYHSALDAVDPTAATLFTIHTAVDELILTQQTDNTTGATFVPANLNLLVYADTVTIRGPLVLPGKTVSIFARVIGSKPDAQNNAAKIDVSGAATGSAPANLPKVSQAANGNDSDSEAREGDTGSNGSAGAAGAAGPDGRKGGKISLYVGGFQPHTTLSLMANGSDGARAQDGQPGQDAGDGGRGVDGRDMSIGGTLHGSAGGNGGNAGVGGAGGTGGMGGDGGTIMVFSLLPPSELTLNWSVNGGRGGDAGNGGEGGKGGRGGRDGKNPRDGHHSQYGWAGIGGSAGLVGFGGIGGGVAVSTTINSASRQPFPALSNQADWAWFNVANAGFPGAFGTPGTTGTRGWQDGSVPPALNRPAGRPAMITGELGVRSMTDADLTYCASAPQCSMVMQKAKLLYLMAGPDLDPATHDQAAAILLWLQNITAAFARSGSPVPAGDEVPAPPGEGHPADDLAMLASINSQAIALALQMTIKSDFFGNPSGYVPQGSHKTYSKLLDDVLGSSGTFKPIEDNYLNYFTVSAEQKKTLDQLGVAKTQSDSQTSSLTTQKQAALDSANALAVIITADETAVANQLPIMKNAISSVERALGLLAGAGCIFDSLVKAMGTIATQTKDKKTKLAAKIAAPVNQGLQSAFASSLGLDSLPTTNLVQKVDVLGEDVKTIGEGYTTNNGMITTEDPHAYKLLAGEDAFDKILQPYIDLPEAKAAKEAIQQYVKLVLQRNADVLKYNGYLAQIASLKGQIAQHTAQLNQVKTALAQQSNPALAPLVAFMARLYHDARAQAIHMIYMASRSFAFWSLKPNTSAFTVFVGLTDPTGINCETLHAAMQNIVDSLGDAIEKFKTGPQKFPADSQQSPTSGGTQVKPTGVAFKLTDDQNPGIFATLKTPNANHIHQVSFSVPPALKHTRETDSPFYDKANVRLSKVRAWVYGATTDNHILNVDITHSGSETIVDPLDAANSFTHEPVTKTFRFDHSISPAYKSEAIKVDGDFEYKARDNDYAQPGPFTLWTITIDPAFNTGLNMTGVNEITLEFFGNSYPFE